MAREWLVNNISTVRTFFCLRRHTNVHEWLTNNHECCAKNYSCTFVLHSCTFMLRRRQLKGFYLYYLFLSVFLKRITYAARFAVPTECTPLSWILENREKQGKQGKRYGWKETKNIHEHSWFIHAYSCYAVGFFCLRSYTNVHEWLTNNHECCAK